MLTHAAFVEDLVIHATDGELGSVDHFLFDDETWAIHYWAVKTGGWLSGRQVLISPLSVLRADWQSKRLDVTLTKKQVENSPDIDTEKPISRQHEMVFLGYYGYPYYWEGSASLPPSAAEDDSVNSHLRSSEEVSGYDIEASDGDIGHVDGFIVDDEAWAVRYIEIATRNWLPGKKVLLAPEWIERISWEGSKVYAAVSKEALQSAPEYIMSEPLTREYENRLYFHYGKPPYWLTAG